MKKVFLGGTCNGSTWRTIFEQQLKIDYFNSVVAEWNDAAQAKELYERENCDYCLYVITPKATGFYSIAEVIDDSNKRPEKTIFCFVDQDWEDVFIPVQIKSLIAIGKMVKRNGGNWFTNIQEVIEFLNKQVI